MRSSKEEITAALEVLEDSYRRLAALPLEALSRTGKHAFLKRLEDLDNKMKAFDRRLIGRLITEADPAQFGGSEDVHGNRLVNKSLA